MASQSVAAKSRLSQMQMRFQQKQQQQREQARAEMTTTVTSVTSETTFATNGVGNGRVRQMFDERRRGAGIDRSNPLKPIDSKTKEAKSLGVLNPAARRTPMAAPPRRPSGNAETLQRTLANGTAAHNERLRSHGGMDNYAKQHIVGDRNNNKSSGSSRSETNSTAKPTSGIKLKPVVTKKSPSVSGNRVPPTRQPATPLSSAGKKTSVFKATTPEKSTTTVTSSKASAKTPFTKMSTSNNVMQTSKTTSRLSTVPAEGLAECKYCSRTFNIDRLTKHEAVCQKISATKRKIFDASKHRVQGTEAEHFVKKQTLNPQSFSRISSVAMSTQHQLQPKKSDWRKKHQEFIMAIRSAKQVQAHLAKGGKLSDLPPPPPSENADYIQCPNCLRRFNQTAAERHIPKCASMQHNKPRPSVSVKKQR